MDARPDLLPPLPVDWKDPVIEFYKSKVDRRLLALFARLTPEERLLLLELRVRETAEAVRRAKMTDRP